MITEAKSGICDYKHFHLSGFASFSHKLVSQIGMGKLGDPLIAPR